MSGFAVVVPFDQAPIDEDLLALLAAALRFRAPDGEATKVVDGAGFACAHMHIQGEPPAGHQPMCLDGRWWIAAHARLYGRAALVDALRGAGAEARADQPDAWLILLAHRAWGSRCLTRLNGDFSFAIWDSRERELFCASDQVGSRAVSYRCRGRSLQVSNTLSVLRDVFDERDLDNLFIADFLCLEFSLVPEATAYRHIRRLPPAHTLTMREGQAPKIERYWTLPAPAPDLSLGTADTLERFRSVFKTAVLDRVPDGPVAIGLSGGLDSTAIAAVVSTAGISGVKSFTRGSKLGIDDPEPPLARMVAESLQLPHELLDMDRDLPFEDWDRRTPFMPEPLNEPYWGGKHVARQALAAHSRVVLVGEGGDEVLSSELACNLVGHVPVSRLIQDVGRYRLRYGRRPPIGLKRTLRRWRGVTPDYGEFARPPGWVHPDLVRQWKLDERMRDYFNGLEVPANHPTHPIGSKRLSWAIQLTHGGNDPGAMGLPLEYRTPFLDVRLMEFVYSLPPLHWCTRKAILREAMSEQLPEAIVSRPKTGVPRKALVNKLGQIGMPWWDSFQPAQELGRFIELTRIPGLRNGVQSSAPEVVKRDLRAIGLNYWLRSLHG